MNFNELRNKIQNPTQKQIDDAIKESINGCTTLKELNDFILQFHPNDAYRIIRDFIQPKSNMLVRRGANDEDKSEYQRFQNIQQESKRIFDYLRKTATMFDVQQVSEAAQRYYAITVRMISEVDNELGEVEAALNRIEEHIGLDVTKFEVEENGNDTTDGNEQGIKETTE